MPSALLWELWSRAQLGVRLGLEPHPRGLPGWLVCKGSQIKGLNPFPREDTCSDVSSLKSRTCYLTQKQNVPCSCRGSCTLKKYPA